MIVATVRAYLYNLTFSVFSAFSNLSRYSVIASDASENSFTVAFEIFHFIVPFRPRADIYQRLLLRRDENPLKPLKPVFRYNRDK